MVHAMVFLLTRDLLSVGLQQCQHVCVWGLDLGFFLTMNVFIRFHCLTEYQERVVGGLVLLSAVFMT